MVKGEITGCNFEGGFSSLVYDGNLHDEEQPSYPQSNQNRQPVSTYRKSPGGLNRPAAVSLALLAAVLLMVDIGLGVHYNKLPDTRPNDTERISNELAKLQDTYKAAVESLDSAKKQLDSEMSRQIPTEWELEHQTRRSTKYKEQFVTKTEEAAKLKYQIEIMSNGCKYCPPRWIFLNSVCYYFPFSESDGVKTWQKARDYCQMYGGDLAVIDSKDKEKATVNHLLDNNKYRPNPTMGLWIGLKNFPKEDTWRWVDGRALVEGYWGDGEPNSNKQGDSDCGVVHAKENFFKAWNDVRCGQKQKWICEKAPNYTT
ncbi:uncharacterized protein LOC117267004 [Epinephelus lanceolatus]